MSMCMYTFISSLFFYLIFFNNGFIQFDEMCKDLNKTLRWFPQILQLCFKVEVRGVSLVCLYHFIKLFIYIYICLCICIGICV